MTFVPDSTGVAGDWMQTHTGVKFTPLAPRVEDINIRDIAHALALQCRYAGHVKAFYSVAQHSVLVSRILPPELKLAGLLHDAAEAYLQDMIRPLKVSPFGEMYREFEDRLMRAIAERFGLIYPFPPEVKRADNIALFTEKRDLMNVQIEWAGERDYQPLPDRIVPWSSVLAESVFIGQYNWLSELARAEG